MRTCEWCEGDLSHKRSDARFCDRRCKTRASDARRIADGRSVARDRARYSVEAEHRRAYAREYLRANPERMRAIRRRRKGQIRADLHLVLEREWRRMVHRYRGLCAYCQTEPIEHRDHVIPLARDGRHSIGNLLPACAGCNYRKRTKFLSAWRYLFGGAPALHVSLGVSNTP